MCKNGKNVNVLRKCLSVTRAKSSRSFSFVIGYHGNLLTPLLLVGRALNSVFLFEHFSTHPGSHYNRVYRMASAVIT